MKMNKGYWIWWGIKGFLWFTLWIFGFGLVVMLLWNAVIPAIFTTAPEITYWQALGILVLARLLFRGFGWGCGWRGKCGHYGGHGGWKHHGHWRQRWEEKMAAMTPEEREKLRKRWGNCGYDWEEKDKEDTQG